MDNDSLNSIGIVLDVNSAALLCSIFNRSDDESGRPYATAENVGMFTPAYTCAAIAVAYPDLSHAGKLLANTLSISIRDAL